MYQLINSFNSFFTEKAIYILLPLKSSAHDICITPNAFSLFLVVYFDLPITRTFFDFPWSFELSGVYCTWIKLFNSRSTRNDQHSLIQPWQSALYFSSKTDETRGQFQASLNKCRKNCEKSEHDTEYDTSSAAGHALQ